MSKIKERNKKGHDDYESDEEYLQKCSVCLLKVSSGRLCGRLSCEDFRSFYCGKCHAKHLCRQRVTVPNRQSSDSSSSGESTEDNQDYDEKSNTDLSLKKERIKKRNKKIGGIAKDKRKAIKNGQKKEKLLLEHLGSTDAVSVTYYKGKRSFVYKCPECKAFITEKLARHLLITHKKSSEDARLMQTKMRVFYLWCNSDKHNTHLPLPCDLCGEWHLRLDKHLSYHKAHRIKSEEDRFPILEAAKEKYWAKGQKIEPGEQNNYSEAFVRRTSSVSHVAKEMSTQPVQLAFYTPGNSLLLQQEDKVKWNIKEEDFFTIYFSSSKELLDQFQDSLQKSGSEKNTAIQHRNQVELIWSTIDERMEMFPNSLANIHLFRDLYHFPTLQMVGTSGVQAGTLRARYVSIGFFLQFLRKYQVFAGISRAQIQLIEQTIADFNKELNTGIKQRKVVIRCDKRKNLLKASHFIAFGQSNFVQNLIKVVDQPSPNLTVGFAVDFRNYLITSLVIGNGLRSSNIMELRISDFKSFTTAKDYPGHKIIVNDCYKTSTIYGEKFVVVPEQLFAHFEFYSEKLRPLIYIGKSEKAFVTNGENPKMTQTNVSASLTSAFQKSKTLHHSEYQRVSCTRIRCGLATFACNEGGFETAFVANHFMKNKEETTAIHYNLFANQRHALNIAMRLYDSFNISGEKVSMRVDEAQKLFLNSKVDKNKTLQWLKKNDPTLTNNELRDFEDVIEEIESETASPASFYGIAGKGCEEKNELIENKPSASNTSENQDDFELRKPIVKERVGEEEDELVENKPSALNFSDEAKSSRLQLLEKLCGTPKRKGAFNKDTLRALKRSCAQFILTGNIVESKVMAAVRGEDLLQKFTFSKIRSKILYLRLQLSQHVTLNGQKQKRSRKLGTKCLTDDSDSDSDFAEINHEEKELDNSVDDLEKNEELKQRETEKKDDFGPYFYDPKAPTKKTPPVSKVIAKCNKIFQNPPVSFHQPSIRRKRESEMQKAERLCLLSDQDGFEKIFIHDDIGYGIFATKSFATGQYLLAYKGPLLDAIDGEKRIESDHGGNFLFFFEYMGKKLCIDASVSEGLCKFVNDSSDCNSKIKRVISHDGKPQLCLFATKDIEPGREIRYNYGEDPENLWWRDKGRWNLPLFKPDMLQESCRPAIMAYPTPSDDIIPPTPPKKRKVMQNKEEEEEEEGEEEEEEEDDGNTDFALEQTTYERDGKNFIEIV